MHYSKFTDTSGKTNSSKNFHNAMVWPSQVAPSSEDQSFEAKRIQDLLKKIHLRID